MLQTLNYLYSLSFSFKFRNGQQGKNEKKKVEIIECLVKERSFSL